MIKLEDREKIESLRLTYCHKTSSHSFLSLFIYAQSFGYETIVCDDGYYTTEQGGLIHFPVGSNDFKKRVLLENKDKQIIFMRDVDAEFTQTVFPGFSYEADPDRSEYIYDRIEQTELQGHKFQKVRAKLSRFCRENNAESVPITQDNICIAYELLEKWEPKSGEGDKAGAKKALDNFSALGLFGTVALIDGKPVGYVCGGDIGYGINLLCSAKQISDIQGLNIFTKYEYYKTLPDSVCYINTESDHGSPGIRMHKNDLRPIFKNEMFTGRL